MTQVSIGSVSTDTLRPEDLIPRFLHVLVKETAYSMDQLNKMQEIKRRTDNPKYWDDDLVQNDLDWLIDALGEFAPPYCYFGTLLHDGANFGFWPDWDVINQEIDVKVDDLSKIADDYTGDAMLVNDHGNATLYSVANGEPTEIWAVV